MRFPAPLVAAALLVAGCGTSTPEASAPAFQASWMGARPADPEAAETFDAIQGMLTSPEKRAEWNAVQRLAFHPETVPALVAFMEKGDTRQRRAAFEGMRMMAWGVARMGSDGPGLPEDEYQRRRVEVLSKLAEPATLARVEAGFALLMKPTRKVFQRELDLVKAGPPFALR